MLGHRRGRAGEQITGQFERRDTVARGKFTFAADADLSIGAEDRGGQSDPAALRKCKRSDWTAARSAQPFEQAAVDCVTDRLRIALANMTDVDTLVVAGGVAANATVRGALEALAADHAMRFAAPPPRLCTDNAAMIAWAGIERLGQDDPLDISARPRWPLDPGAEPVRGAGVKA